MLQEAAAAGVSREGSDQRLLRLMLAQILCQGRHTITGLACTAGRQFRDWSYDYRFCQKVAVDQVLAQLRQRAIAMLPEGAPVVIAMDDTVVRKRGRKIPGAAWKADPLSPPFQVNLIWAQRWLECSLLLPCGDEGAARAIPIEFLHVPTAAKPGRKATEQDHRNYREQQRQMNINRRALECAQRLRDELRRDLLLVTDGRFANGTMLKGLPPGIQMLCRIRSDAHLSAVPTAQQSKRRKYGDDLPTPEAMRQDPAVTWRTIAIWAGGRKHQMRIKVIRQVMWRAAGQRHVFDLIVIAPLSYRLRKGGKLLYRQPGYLLCTSGTLKVKALVQHYVNRWDIEVNIRDEKQVMGVGEAMLRHPKSAEKMPRLAVAAYSMLLLAARQAYGSQGLAPLLLPAWRRSDPPRRASTNSLVNQLRCELARPILKQQATSHFWARPKPSMPRTARQQPEVPPIAPALDFGYALA